MYNIKRLRGTKDLFGQDAELFNQIVQCAKNFANKFGYHELIVPIIEKAALFTRNLGEDSDVVSKEIYSFCDKSNELISLRPEFTACVVRCVLENGLHCNPKPQRYFSYGPNFRYDRPQLGRQRQFNQLNFEAFGSDNSALDVECIVLANQLLESICTNTSLKIKINFLPYTNESMIKYVESLKSFFNKKMKLLSEASKDKIKNPVRILDSKSPDDIDVCKQAPSPSSFFSKEDVLKMEMVLKSLKELKIDYEEDNALVRGMDYYTGMVFEIVPVDASGSQSSIAGGGRYNDLFKKISGKHSLPAVGFAAGIERLMQIAELKNKYLDIAIITDVSFIAYAFKVQNAISELKIDLQLRIKLVCESVNISKNLDVARRMGCNMVIIANQNEVDTSTISIKDMTSGTQESFPIKSVSQIQQFIQKAAKSQKQ